MPKKNKVLAPRCYQCESKPARSLRLNGRFGEPVFCSLRCAAEAAYYEIGTRHRYCPIHQTWNHEDDLVLGTCPLCDVDKN